MATDLDKWKTKPTIDVLQDAQCIVDKYRDQMQEADYIALCNANRVRYARHKRKAKSPGSVNSNESQDRGFVQPTVADFEYRISYLREKMEMASYTLRHLPRTAKVVTPVFKKRAIRAFADEMDLDETVTTYEQLRAIFPEIKYENDFYMTAMRILNKRLDLIRQDLKNEIGAQKAAIKHLETRLHTNFRDGTSFLT